MQRDGSTDLAWCLISPSFEQTKRLGNRLGKLLQGGEIVGLVGELGAGKTSLVRGVVEGLGVGKEGWIRSPTFTLVNEYHGRLPVYHIDLYRIDRRADIEALNLREYLYADGVSLIEWFERLPPDEVDEYLEVKIAHAGASERELVFTAHGERYERLLEEFKSLKVQGFNRSKSLR